MRVAKHFNEKVEYRLRWTEEKRSTEEENRETYFVSEDWQSPSDVLRSIGEDKDWRYALKTGELTIQQRAITEWEDCVL